MINSTSSQTYTPFENPVPLISFLVFEFVCFSSDPKKEQIPLAGWRVLFVGFVYVCLGFLFVLVLCNLLSLSDRGRGVEWGVCVNILL